jgi:hypothetical protein
MHKLTLLAALAAAGLAAAGIAGPAWAEPMTGAASAWAGRASDAATQRSANFNDVSCAGQAFCAAVGNVFTHPGTAGAQAQLAEIWNGTAWTVTPTPYQPNGSASQWLQAVSCTSPGFCAAVGNYADAGSGLRHGLVETWNGTAWTGQAMPDPPGALTSTLHDVSCTAPDSCVAVGSSALPNEYGQEISRSVAWHWNGTQWAVVKVSGLGLKDVNSSFEQISCSSAASCTAIGQFPLGDDLQTQVAARYNGTSWTVQALPGKPGSLKNPFVQEVTCTSAASCIAAGAGTAGALVERWNGTTWSVQRVPQPAHKASAGLFDASCTSPVACTAVGGYTTAANTNPQALIERWNGTTWSIQASPAIPGEDVSLFEVSCAAANACTAVGSLSHNSVQSDRTLAESWNGTAWTVQPTPDISN